MTIEHKLDLDKRGHDSDSSKSQEHFSKAAVAQCLANIAHISYPLAGLVIEGEVIRQTVLALKHYRKGKRTR